MRCLICSYAEDDLVKFARHLQFCHGMSSLQYTITYLFNGKRPRCAACKEETRYTAFAFKKYCKEHLRLAEAEAGTVGGKKKKTWNKGRTKETDNRILQQSLKITGENNHFYGKCHSAATVEKLRRTCQVSEEQYYDRLSQRCYVDWRDNKEKKENYEFELFTKYEDYFSRQHQYLELCCLKCNSVESKTLQAFERGSRCHKCYRITKDSIGQEQVKQFIESLGVPTVKNDRKLIKPKEIDIYAPEKQFAVEYNGLFWHDENHVEKRQHAWKTEQCRKQGVQLFHIFSDEWRDKKEIVKSMLRYRLGKIEEKVMARKCQTRELSPQESQQFFEENHISGATKAKITFALVYQDRVVAALSLRKPRQSSKYAKTLEIARYATALNISVNGGFGKLLKKAKEYAVENGYDSVLSYCDLRFGDGNVYAKNGFKYCGKTAIDYWYCDTECRYDRFKFRAKNGKTERQIANEAQVARIYGCGSNIYVLKLP